jgi:hypothetical protein
MARTTGRSGFKMRSGNTSTFKTMGSSPMRIDPTDPKDPKDKVSPPSDRDELVEHTYAAGSPEARGEGWKAISSRTVLISKGTQRLINAGAPKDIIAKSKLRDIELFKAQEE